MLFGAFAGVIVLSLVAAPRKVSIDGFFSG